jgi:hypothetical protein
MENPVDLAAQPPAVLLTNSRFLYVLSHASQLNGYNDLSSKALAVLPLWELTGHREPSPPSMEGIAAASVVSNPCGIAGRADRLESHRVACSAEDRTEKNTPR